MAASWLDARGPHTDASARPEMACGHCGLPLGDRASSGFCCEGCRLVHEALRETGMLRYYALRGASSGLPAPEASTVDSTWLAKEEAELSTEPPWVSRAYTIDGIHCAGCVWILEKVFDDLCAQGTLVVNPTRGVAQFKIPSTFPLAEYGARIAKFGYQLRPLGAPAERSELLVRMGLAIAIAMNAMLFSIAVYAGLRDGELYVLFQRLTAALALMSVVVGGSVFFRATYHGLRLRRLTLDAPISLGIVLGFLGSAISLFVDGGAHAYFDTLTVFIALMLVGRWMKERVIDDNRRRLVDAESPANLWVRVERTKRIEIVSVHDVRPGERLLLLPFEVLPVDAKLLDGRGFFGFEWLNGESDARELCLGDVVESGARNAGSVPLRVEVLHAFHGSTLERILATPVTETQDETGAKRGKLESRVANVWVPSVIAAAIFAFATHAIIHGDLYQALTVATAVLIVTCPCAFGIASPLGIEIALARLRKAGLLVRSATFLERAADVTIVAFDKTGTLTEGTSRPELERLVELSSDDAIALYNMAVRTAHPKARGVLEILPECARVFRPDLLAAETLHAGIALNDRGDVYRLGAPSYAVPNDPSNDADLVFSKNGGRLANFQFVETLRPDARTAIGALHREGFDVVILSGDTEKRVRAVADSCGVEPQSAYASLSPQEKAEMVHSLGSRRPLMIGDGLNDTLATERAYCSGTSSEGRAFLAARADFFMLAPGLKPIVEALSLARRLRRVVRANLVLALLYNIIALGLSIGGLMSPLLCAVFMPVSSLIALTHTSVRMRSI
jgi:P-type Cu2+ transporter